VAGYAVKTAASSPGLAKRIRSSAELERLNLRPHLRALVRTAWTLERRRDAPKLGLRDHAHTFGYPGQFSSKSLRYSTTFAALRRARADYVEELRGVRPDYDGEWCYAGRGYHSAEAESLAEALNDARMRLLRGSRTVPGTYPPSSPETSPPP
jgi:hypothetical protein